MKNSLLEIKIIKAKLEDAAQISVLMQTVYIETYGVEGVSKEFTNFILEQFSSAKIKADILTDDCAIWIAKYNNNCVGMLKFEYNKPCKTCDFIGTELNKIYILKNFYGKGIGKALIGNAEKYLKGKNKRIWLWVLHSNVRAIKFYESQNFKKIGTAIFEMEVNNYTNLVMSKTIQ